MLPKISGVMVFSITTPTEWLMTTCEHVSSKVSSHVKSVNVDTSRLVVSNLRQYYVSFCKLHFVGITCYYLFLAIAILICSNIFLTGV